MKDQIRSLTFSVLFICILAAPAAAQNFQRDIKVSEGGTIAVVNYSGRVFVSAKRDATAVTVNATSTGALAESDRKISTGGSSKIEVSETIVQKRVDLSLTVPERVRLRIETREGEVRVEGDLESVEARTETGTIAADVPLTDLKYDFLWTASRPRYLSDVELEKVKELVDQRLAQLDDIERLIHRGVPEGRQGTWNGPDAFRRSIEGLRERGNSARAFYTDLLRRAEAQTTIEVWR